MNIDDQQGFTLLEVLLAGFILFMTIATMTLVYSGSMLASHKAENSMVMNTAAHAIRRVVSDEFRYGASEGLNSGGGRHGDVFYQWVAKVSHRGTQLGAADGSTPDKSLSIWEIELSLTRGKAYKVFTFLEVI